MNHFTTHQEKNTDCLQDTAREQPSQESCSAIISQLGHCQLLLFLTQWHQITNDLQKLVVSLLEMLSELTPNLKEVAQRDQQLETLNYNLEQVKLKTESMDRKMDHLTDDFLDRQVRTPLLKELVYLYDCLLLEDGKCKTEDRWSVMADRIAQVLDAYDLHVIQPSPGDSFNPREHHPLHHCAVQDPAQHQQIAQIFHCGLASSTRVIFPARVEVLVFQPSTVKTKPLAIERHSHEE